MERAKIQAKIPLRKLGIILGETWLMEAVLGGGPDGRIGGGKGGAGSMESLHVGFSGWFMPFTKKEKIGFEERKIENPNLKYKVMRVC